MHFELLYKHLGWFLFQRNLVMKVCAGLGTRNFSWFLISSATPCISGGPAAVGWHFFQLHVTKYYVFQYSGHFFSKIGPSSMYRFEPFFEGTPLKRAFWSTFWARIRVEKISDFGSIHLQFWLEKMDWKAFYSLGMFLFLSFYPAYDHNPVLRNRLSVSEKWVGSKRIQGVALRLKPFHQ